MVSKKNFQQNGRLMHQHRPVGSRRDTATYKKILKAKGEGVSHNFTEMMFNASQIPDNPGYMDFNNPTPPINNGPNKNTLPQNVVQHKKKIMNKNKPNIKQPPIAPLQQNGNMTWHNNKASQPPPMLHINKRINNGMPRRFNPVQVPPPPPYVGRRMLPPPVGMVGPRNGMMPPPMPPMPPNFQAPPHPPPMGRGLPPPPPPPQGMFLRRNVRGPLRMPPPPMMPMMMGPPRMPMGMPPGPIPNNIGKIKKPNIKWVKKTVKSKSTIKTLKNLITQYPLDKPWVTVEIRLEHDKKIEIENKLKGNKDDELFAQFKIQRDKFVAMYEAAREDYLKQEAAAVKTKDAKDKQTINKTDAKDDNNEAN